MKIQCLVYTRPNMFLVNSNMYNMIGVGELQRLFAGEVDFRVNPGSTLRLFYPERFLNIVEERQIMVRAEKAGYAEVEITTHSVYILQTVDHKYIRIVDSEDFTQFAESDTGKCSNDIVGLPNDSVLGVVVWKA